MRRPHYQQRRSPLIFLGCLVLTIYFVQHAVYGKHGVMARGRLIERSLIAERELTKAEARRAELRLEVSLLSDDPPHPDLVAEFAMAVLGYGRPGDRFAPLRGR